MGYDKNQKTSYAIGMYATIELLKHRLKDVIGVYYSKKIKLNENTDKIFSMCKKHNIMVIERTNFIEKIAAKENVFIVGEFRKYKDELVEGNHVVLVNPSDMGNLGTIFRTCLGFNISNIAIIKPCADIFNPKVVRASQGAVFGLKICEFESFNEYKHVFKNNQCFMFCLKATKFLQDINKKPKPYSLVFGNEATGLPQDVLEVGNKIKIRQSGEIDSYNLAISVAIALYEFNR